MSENLWPEFDSAPPMRTVRRILFEAGEGLSLRTKDALRFTVISTPENKRFVHRCDIDAPKLAYRYPLLLVKEESDPFPVKLTADGSFERGVTARDEQGLIENLRDLFHEETTRRVVGQLLDAIAGR